MDINYDSIEEIKNNIKIISSNKLNVAQSKMLFIGFIYEFILNREIFPKNSDLKKFINGDLKKYFNEQKSLKEYLFSSRTLLASRVQKELYESLDYKNIIELVELINDKLLVLENKKSQHKINKNNEKFIDEWRSYFKNKEK